MGIADNIKLRRMQLGLTQQELADKLGYRTRSTITKVENGENQVSKVKLAKFAKALDTSVYFLENGMEEDIDIIKEEISGQATAIILAGGKSSRNQQNIPNQFINVLGKPIIIYVLEVYERHPLIESIYVVCLKDWEGILKAYAKQYGIHKLKGIIPAGETGIQSARNGVEALSCKDDDIVVLQESTRPLITEEILSKLLRFCKNAAVICEPMDDYIQLVKEENKLKYVERNQLFSLQSPEAYRYKTLKDAFRRGDQLKHQYNETCCAMMMYHLGFDIELVEGNHNNIKVIRQEDVAILSAILKNQL